MKRSIWLITVLTLLGVGCGLWADMTQQRTARGYLDGLQAVRQAMEAHELDTAKTEQAYLHALWQHDQKWLNTLVSHHHTRDVSSAMGKLATALENGWRDEALRALDEAEDAFDEVELSDRLSWENVL